MIRQRYIDIVKGLSILCIVLLHYGLGAFPNQINVFIGSFMITAFYVTSGWVDGMSTKKLPIKILFETICSVRIALFILVWHSYRI